MPVIEKKLFNLLVDRSWAIDQSEHPSVRSTTDLENFKCFFCAEKNFPATDYFIVN